MKFCNECGNRLKIFKKKNKFEYFFRCKKCKISLQITEKVVIIRSVPRKNWGEHRILFCNLQKIKREKGVHFKTLEDKRRYAKLSLEKWRIAISLDFIDTPNWTLEMLNEALA